MEPLQLHDMLVEPDPDAGAADRQALIDLALEPGEEGFSSDEEQPSSAADAQSIAEERYAQQMLNRRANMQAHQKAQP